MGLRNITIRSLKWSFIEKFGQFVIQFLISIVLARLLGPEDFGMFGILTVFVLISNTIVDSGFSQGLIRKLDCTFSDYNSVFWFNAGLGLGIYMCLYFSMPYITHLFSYPRLTEYSRWLFLIIPIGSLNIVHLTRINKELQFKKIALYTVLSFVLSGVMGVVLAYMGYGIWSLIVQSILGSFFLTLFVWIKSDWKPNFAFSFQPIKELLPFTHKLFLSSFLNTVFNNVYVFVIAKFYPPVSLGYYSQASRFATQPTILMDSILSRMSYPVLSTLQHDLAAYRNYYKKLNQGISVIVLIMMSSIFLSSEEIVLIVLGEKWLPILPYFKILCVASMTFPFHPLCMSTLKVFGYSGLILKLEIAKKVLMIALILLTYLYSVYHLVIGQLIFFLLVLPVNMYFSGRIIKYTLFQQLRDMLPLVVITAISMILSYFFGLLIDNIYLKLFVKVVSSFTTFVSLLLIINVEGVSSNLKSLLKAYIAPRYENL